jgi:hypothetical protein
MFCIPGCFQFKILSFAGYNHDAGVLQELLDVAQLLLPLSSGKTLVNSAHCTT